MTPRALWAFRFLGRSRWVAGWAARFSGISRPCGYWPSTAHADPRHYNAVQRLAYLFVMLDSVLLVLSGLVLWKSVQFPLLRELMGGYEGARRVHFFAMAALAAFVVIHLVMVALVPRTLVYMVRGR